MVRLEQPGRGHGTQDDDGGGPHAGGGGDVDHVVQACPRDALTGQGALLDQRDRRGRVRARVERLRGQGRQRAHAHEDDDGARPVPQAREGRRRPAVVPVHHVHGTDRAAVRQRDAGGGGRTERAAHPGDDLDGHVGLPAGEHLLAAPAVHERVTALEPHDDASALGLLDQDPTDLVLRHRVVARASCRRR